MRNERVCRSYGWGDPVKWGPSNLVDSADECCEQCLQYKPQSMTDQSCNGVGTPGIVSMCSDMRRPYRLVFVCLCPQQADGARSVGVVR